LTLEIQNRLAKLWKKDFRFIGKAKRIWKVQIRARSLKTLWRWCRGGEVHC